MTYNYIKGAFVGIMSHRFATFAMLILLSALLALMIIAYYQYYTRPTPLYFGVKPDRSQFAIQSLDRPNLAPRVLTRWATLAATATFTIDFVHYEENLKNLRHYFTEEGYNFFLNALTESHAITDITEKKLVVSAIAVAPTIITSEGIGPNGKYTWEILVPILVSYLSASADVKQPKIVSLTVTQVPTEDAPTGIGISRYTTFGVNLQDITG